MVIAKRVPTLRSPVADLEVPISIFLPEQEEGAWACRYEIGWPEDIWSSIAYGLDSAQALILAFQKIGTEIYFSHHHKSGNLFWEKPGSGYGFPVPHNARDLLVGDDAVFY